MNMRERQEWTESLRPDELTGARLRRAINEAAAPLLAARRDAWWEIASRWAGLLTPIGVAATLAFAALAVRNNSVASPPSTSVAVLETPETRGTADVFEALRSEMAPVGFTEFAGVDDAVVFAAMGEGDQDARSRSTVTLPGEH